MTDRLDEIRERQETTEHWPQEARGHIAYLLGEVARLQYLNDELEQENREFREMKVCQP